MRELRLSKEVVLDFLSRHKLMTVATYGIDHPWIASVYYSFDRDLNLYFLSDPLTLHCRQITSHERVAVAIADSRQAVESLKRGLQLWGVAKEVSGAGKIKHALRLWKDMLKISNKELSYENMLKKVIKGKIYKITPKRIKLFDQERFPVEDGQEPTLEL